MRFAADSGLWTTGPRPDAMQLTAVLEVSGAVLSWSVDGPESDVHIAFTDPVRADWLWLIVGESAHSAIVSALEAVPDGQVEVEGVTVRPAALDPLRRLALGHWMRRWWPASVRDGIPELDAAALDGELALLTAAAGDYFADDTFDSDVAELMRPHAGLLEGLARLGDPRVADLARACAELAADIGVEAGPAAVAVQVRRDDYALVAGDVTRRGGAAIATGVASVNWSAVPPGVFDAAENTVTWRVESADDVATAVARVELSGRASAAGIAVRVSSGAVGGAGTLDASGAATIALVGEDQTPITESVAWGHDWRETAVTIGADVGEPPQLRQRVRTLARTRLARPGPDAFLAELLAAESDY
ncbi:hypothetical protein [Mycolicibacterium austroafricanum]|uniref:hypothetical protein n=1 Tax=Mycolicibacterium austroafricanum TaxID=39687 RepID=UPI001CA37886|nr:hypothetical protein [Mycolicibacterium austroafricanum]QZT65118.1 hypothetical protein JN085_12825 [Mycolicibacterium austroafricanum]